VVVDAIAEEKKGKEEAEDGNCLGICEGIECRELLESPCNFAGRVVHLGACLLKFLLSKIDWGIRKSIYLIVRNTLGH